MVLNPQITVYLVERFARSLFSVMAALKMVSKCSLTLCKLRFFDNFRLTLTKNLHRAKLSSNIIKIKKTILKPTHNLKLRINSTFSSPSNIFIGDPVLLKLLDSR